MHHGIEPFQKWKGLTRFGNLSKSGSLPGLLTVYFIYFSRDPKAVNVLTIPNSNLLTVAANGAIIGVQQTIGYMKSQPTLSTLETPPKSVADAATRRVTSNKQQQNTSSFFKATITAPSEAENAPSTSPNLPQSTNTHLPAPKIQISSPAIMPAKSLLPKIDAVFTLAESGICSSFNNHAKASTGLYGHVPLDPRVLTCTAESIQRLDKVSPDPLNAKMPGIPNSHHTKVKPKKGVKRKAISTSSDRTSKNQKKSLMCSNGSLKVKLSWNKFENVYNATHSKDKQNSTSGTSKNLNVNKTTTTKKCSTDISEEQEDIPQKKSKKVIHQYSNGKSVVINLTQGYQFTHDTKNNTTCINNKVPLLRLRKCNSTVLMNLGCNPTCPLLQKLSSTKSADEVFAHEHWKKKLVIEASKLRKQQDRSEQQIQVVPSAMSGDKSLPQDNMKNKQVVKPRKVKKPRDESSRQQIPSINTLTRHPDFSHISTDDKVAYLKEMLRAQRAALGISV